MTHVHPDEEDLRNERESRCWGGLFIPRQLFCLPPLTLHLTNIVGGLAVGRPWRGDSSASSLKTFSSCSRRGWHSPVPWRLCFLPLPLAHSPQNAPIPLALPSVGTWAWGWFRWAAKEIGHFPLGYPGFYQPAFSLTVSSLPGGSSLWQILVLTAPPWHRSDIGTSGFTFFGPGELPLCLTQGPFTIQTGLSIMAWGVCLAWHLAVPNPKTWYLSPEDIQEMMS